jgi:hypothetical protein
LVTAWPRPLYGVRGTRLLFFLVSLLTSRGRDALLHVGLVSPHTVERHVHRNHAVRVVRLVGSMGNLCGTRYPSQSTWSLAMPHRETSHKSSTVKPIGPRPPPQWPEGKMPPPKGGQPGRLQSRRLRQREREMVSPRHRVPSSKNTSSTSQTLPPLFNFVNHQVYHLVHVC